MKLGSLFDGSGGFPLAGAINGITPVWASEIEPYPIAVTTARFPSMKHLGSITEISGGSIEPVDIITFGSPCQDLSIAGNQKGIENGARSSLFFQAIRIIKEMRDATNGVCPNYAVWENVPGAFSSNKGNDFRLVLEALASISEPTVSIPMPEKWQRAGEIVGNGWSIAWRTLDAQYWGVPQRRKRIYLVADFGSERAGQILFERESVRGNPAEGREAGERTAEDAEGSAGGSCGAFCAGASPLARSIGWSEDVSPTLKSASAGLSMHAVCYPSIARTLEARYDSSPCIDRGMNIIYIHDKATRFQGGGDTRNNDGSGNGLGVSEDGVEYTLTAADRHGVCYQDKCGALCANSHTGSYTGQDAFNDMLIAGKSPIPPRKYIVRRLTPTECARLQGFPDHWGDVAVKGKPHSDSAEYKMWGNGIALPCAVFVLGQIVRIREV